MNKVILAGRLAKDPEIRYTQTGKAVASFPLAVSRRRQKNADTNQPTADFIPIIAWEKTAEAIGNHMTKGSQMCVSGHIQVRSYQDRSGATRYATEVIAEDVEFMGSKSQGTGGAPQAPQASPSGGYEPSLGTEDIYPDEEIPF